MAHPQPDPLVLQQGRDIGYESASTVVYSLQNGIGVTFQDARPPCQKYGPKPEFLTSPQNRTFSRIRQESRQCPPSVENIAPIALQSVGITEKFAGFGLAEDAFTTQGVDERTA